MTVTLQYIHYICIENERNKGNAVVIVAAIVEKGSKVSYSDGTFDIVGCVPEQYSTVYSIDHTSAVHTNLQVTYALAGP